MYSILFSVALASCEPDYRHRTVTIERGPSRHAVAAAGCQGYSAGCVGSIGPVVSSGCQGSYGRSVTRYHGFSNPVRGVIVYPAQVMPKACVGPDCPKSTHHDY